MNTLRTHLHSLIQAAAADQRLPKLLAASGALILGALSLTAAVMVHRIPPLEWTRIAGVFLFCLIGMVLAAFHVRRFPPKGVDISTSRRILWTSVFLAIAGVQIARYALSVQSEPVTATAFLAMAPVVALGLLVSGLLGPPTALVAITLTVIVAGAAGVEGPTLLAAAWITGAVGAHAVNPLRHRSDLIRSGQVTTVTFAVSALAVALLEGAGAKEALMFVAWSVVAGVGGVALFWLAMIAVFERSFGVVSDWSLHELCNPEQPLLRELVLHAPGTYAHSVMVGNLSEQAARAIGANALLCRAMANYHDVGKSKRPEFFIENNHGENPHDRLTPSLSAKIISIHVRDGLEMAEKHNLPPAIRDGIAEHHGTSLISYFYHQLTKDSGEEDPILEHHFRYPGPKPKSKETAVLMLADRVEAATRTLSIESPGRLRSFVWEIVQGVRDDGQLDDSELNFRDLQIIVDSFVSSLKSLRHHRIEYPGVALDAVEQEPSDTGSEPHEAQAESQVPAHGLAKDARN
ncbi:MAG: HDIG domain-containing protein [Armatimonadetes bacterium]|nr:HDIG domain-containing protein [Armatimonadota bacterium]